MSKKEKKAIKVEALVNKRPKWPFLIIAIIGFVFFGNTIKNGFNMDDDLVTSTPDGVHQNVEKGIAGIPSIFVSSYVSNSNQNYSYRPVTTSSFAIEYSLFGDKEYEDRASISHFINVMFYIINGWLVYLVLLQLFKKNEVVYSIVAASVFMMHPIHSEVVNNIKCRDELLVLFFGFLALLQFIKYVQIIDDSRKIWRLVLGVLFFVFSALSKKNGLTFVFTIPLILYFFTEVKLKKLGWVFALGLVGAIIFIASEKMVLSDSKVRDVLIFENPLLGNGGFSNKIPMSLYSVGWYLKMMLFPYPLSFYYGYDSLPLANWGHILTWVGFLFVVPLTILSVLRIKKKEWWSFGFLFFMLSIGGVTNIKMIVPGIVAERFAYLPSFGLIAAVCYYGCNWYFSKERKSALRMAIIGVVSVVGFVSLYQNFQRNKNWSDKLTLYKNDLIHNNRSAKSYSLLGQEYIRQAHLSKNNFNQFYGYSDSAVIALKKSLEIYPDYWTSANNIGYVYQSFLMNNESAITYFEKAIKIHQKYPEALFGLASCKVRQIENVNRLFECLGYIEVDSVVSNQIDLTNFTILDPVFKSSYFEREIHKSYMTSLGGKGQMLLNKSKHSSYIAEMKMTYKNFTTLENGLLKNTFNADKELFNPTLEALSLMNEGNYNEMLKTIDQGVGFKFNLFNAAYLKQKFNILHFEEVKTLSDDFKMKKQGLIDTAIIYFYSAINSDALEVRYYQEFAKFLHGQGLDEEFIKVNLLGVSQNEMKDKVQLYVNLANVYNFREDKSAAINYIELALVNAVEIRQKMIDEGDSQQLVQQQNITINGVVNLGIKICEKYGLDDKVQYFKKYAK